MPRKVNQRHNLAGPRHIVGNGLGSEARVVEDCPPAVQAQVVLADGGGPPCRHQRHKQQAQGEQVRSIQAQRQVSGV